MNKYRFTTKTKCGHIDVSVQTANSLQEAKDKFHKFNELTHSKMELVKVESKMGEQWFNV